MWLIHAGGAASGAKAVKLTLGLLKDCVPREVYDDLFLFSFKNQTGVSLKYMLDFGSNPIERQLVHSAQFLHQELPVRLAHRVWDLENVPQPLNAYTKMREVRVHEPRCCCPSKVLQKVVVSPVCNSKTCAAGSEFVHGILFEDSAFSSYKGSSG